MRSRHYSIFILLVAFLTTKASGQDNLTILLDSIAHSGIQQGIPGIQVLISDPEDNRTTHNYGFADITQITPINDSINWRYGSITKLFTAAMILQLESEGKLSIHDAVSDYIDLSRHNRAGITIKQLLNHTSGLYNYTKSPKLQYENTMIECLQPSLKRKLAFTPGSQYSYCNTGYLILGLIIEEVTGNSFEHNIRERIFKPCDLQSMIYCSDEKVPKNTARGYKTKGKRYNDVTNINHSWANSAGAVLGNLSDLHRFVHCLFEGTIIDNKQLEKMISPTLIYRDINAEGHEWFYHAIGLCWDLNLDINEESIYVSHGGNTQGYNCNVHYNTRSNLTILIGMNLFPNGNYRPVFSTQNAIINAIHTYYKYTEEP